MEQVWTKTRTYRKLWSPMFEKQPNECVCVRERDNYNLCKKMCYHFKVQ